MSIINYIALVIDIVVHSTEEYRAVTVTCRNRYIRFVEHSEIRGKRITAIDAAETLNKTVWVVCGIMLLTEKTTITNFFKFYVFGFG